MKTARQDHLDNITEKLGWLKGYIELNNVINLTDISVVSEDFFCDLLNEIYGYNLENLNKKAANYPGIDLGDMANRICVQVTADRSRSKVDKTLGIFAKNNYIEHFGRLIFLILGNRTKFARPFETGMLTFNPKEDVIDINQLILDINKLDDIKISRISSYINNNLIMRNDRIAASVQDFLVNQYKTVYALCITKLKSIGIEDSKAHAIVVDGLANNPFPDLKGVKYLIGGFGTGKSHSLYLYYLYLHRCFQEKSNSVFPAFLDAKELAEYGTIKDWTKAHGIVLDNCTLIIDGLDEIEYSSIEGIMADLDFLDNLYPNFRAIVGSREMSILMGKDKLSVLPLSIPEINHLYCLINDLDSYNVEYSFNNINRAQMLEMLSKPFFAIIYAIYMKNSVDHIKNEMDLTSIFVEKSLSRYINKNRDIHDDLAKIAAISIDRNLGYIHQSEIGMQVDCEKLLSSGFLITDGKNSYTFSLPIVAQWLGAYAIRKSIIEIDTILGDESRTIKWRYSLSILFSQMTYEESEEYFSRIVLKMPGIASLIIKDGIRFDSAVDLPSPDICGKRLYDCMTIWLKALNEIDFGLQKDGINTNTLSCSTNKNKITYAWAHSFLGKEVVSDGITNSNNYPYIGMRAVPAQATWPWIVTFDFLMYILGKYIQQKHWVLPGSRLEHEFIWKSALKLLNKGSLHSDPIQLTAFDRFRRDLDNNISNCNGIDLTAFFQSLDSYTKNGITELVAPYVVGDKEQTSGWVWGTYSSKRMLECITDAYMNAILVYKDFVEEYFYPFKEYMSTYLMLPCSFIGVMQYDEKGGSFNSGPAMSWYMSPLPTGEQSNCNITYGERKNIAEYFDTLDAIRDKTRQLRTKSQYIQTSFHSGKCFDTSGEPVTNIVYEWLKNDLKAIGWLG